MKTILIIGLLLLSPMMAFGLDSEKPDSTNRCPVYNMQIVKSVDSTIAGPGSILTYTILVKNLDSSDVENVLVEDGIPVHTIYVQGSASNNGVYSSTYNKIEWEIALLAAGTEVEFSYQAQIDPGTPIWTEIRNTAKISLPGIFYSNVVITKVRVLPKPKLQIIKQVDKAIAFAGDTLNYTLTISNIGGARADFTDIVDDIPEYSTYILGSAVDGTY
ncbi:MAG: DUF11 domain-containing protein, partial [candidate division Zixibacteria bacterium]|nr:DUF11 domain-containing protein [candidate division Zixibacteria bacterium]